MNSAQEIEAILQDVFEDVALLFGAAAYRLRNEHVWALFRRLDRVRVRTLCRLERQRRSESGESISPRPTHPAVEEFLRRNRGQDHLTSTDDFPAPAEQKEAVPCPS